MWGKGGGGVGTGRGREDILVQYPPLNPTYTNFVGTQLPEIGMLHMMLIQVALLYYFILSTPSCGILNLQYASP